MGFKKRSTGFKRHLYIPDTQVKSGVDTDHLEWAGKFVRERRPDVIVLAGDWYDLPSLSSYDRGTKKAEGRRLNEDLQAGHDALERFMAPWKNIRGYKPRLVVTLGNHENRIVRHANAHPELDGTIGVHNFAFERLGWEVVQFLEPIIIDGIAYQHFFPQNASGNIMQSRNGQTNALNQVRRTGISSTAGHMQGYDTSTIQTLTGPRHGLIAGSFYAHDEAYKTIQGNEHWRGIVLKNRVCNGDYDICPVSMGYLEETYGDDY